MNTFLYIAAVQMDLSAEYPIPLDFLLTDVTQPGTRKASRSLTITLPNTPVNATVFKNLFVLNKDNTIQSYDPNVKVVAFLQTGSSTLIEGYFQLNSIITTDGETLYEGVLISNEMSLFSDMGDKYITGNTDSSDDVDLDTGTTAKLLSLSSNPQPVVDAFADPASTEVSEFMLVDPGTGVESTTWPYYTTDWSNQRLALRFKHIWDRIFLKHGFGYSSDFIETDFFKNLVYVDTHKGLPKLTATEVANIYALVKRTADSANTTSSTFNADFTLEVADTGNRFNLATDVYTNTGTQRLLTASTLIKLVSRLTFTGPHVTAVGQTVTNGITVTIKHNTTALVTAIFSQAILIPAGSYIAGNTIDYPLTNEADYVAFLQAVRLVGNSEPLYIEITQNNDASILSIPATVGVIQSADNYLEIKPTGDRIAFGDRYYNRAVIADKHMQKDFIIDVLKMFNLYLLFKDGEYIIEPRDTFYTLGIEHDWTDLVDRSQPMEIKPLGQLTWKQLQFCPAVDKDYYSKQYQASTGQAYGQQNVLNTNQFNKEIKKVEIKFSSPLLVSNGPTHPKIPHIYDQSGTSKSGVDCGPRYGYWAGWKESDTTFMRITEPAGTPHTWSGYAYVGEFNDPNNPTLSVIYGPPSIIYYTSAEPIAIPSSGLYDYYANEIENQTDLNAKVMTCYVKINPLTINSLVLYDTVVIDGVRWLISKINNYNTAELQPVQVELIQYVI